MKTSKITIKIILSTFIICFSMHAIAGQSCEEHAQKSEVLNTAVNKATIINDKLNETNARVVLIARVGQDLSKYGLRYSHVAFAYKLEGESNWQVIHELNKCGTAQSDLYIEGLGNFLLDDMISYDSKIFIPSLKVQNRLYDNLVNNKENAKSFHDSHYNMVSYAFSTKYQNSNQWVLELMAKSLSTDKNINNREEAQNWLKFMGYKPTTLELGTFTRLGGRMFKANIAFDDQPFGRRMEGHIDTVTVDSIYNFLEKNDIEGNFIELK